MAQKFLHDITILGSDGSTATIEGAGQSTLNLKTTTNSKNNYIVGTTTGSLSFRPNGTTALTINSSSDSTFAGDVNVNTAATNGPSIRLIHPGSSENPEIRIQSGETGTTAFSIYNTATNPDAEQFFINNTLGVSHLGNKRGALKLESSSGVVLTLNGTAATFVGSVTADTIIINDTDGTRGIFRNDSGYDLRLGGGVNEADGAYISLSGGTRGGGTSTFKGRVEIFAGGDNYTAQSQITGDIVLGAHWSGGDKTILHLDSSNTSATFSGDITASGGRIYVKESDLGNTAVAITRDADEGYVQLFNDGTQTVELRGNGVSYINGGNFGIGASNPSYKLQVQGTAYINDTLYVNGNTEVNAAFSQTGGAASSFSGDATFAGTVAVNGDFLTVGNADNNTTLIQTRSTAGNISGIKIARGAGTWSSTGNNNFGLLVSDNGIELAKLTALGQNVTGRAPYLTIADGGNATLAGSLNIGKSLHIGPSQSRYIFNSDYVTVAGSGTSNAGAIEWKEGTHYIPSLAYAFKVRLVTTGTGTDTGANYIVYYNNTDSAWVVRHVSLAGNSSNHPLLTMVSDGTGTYMGAYDNHPGTYHIRYFVESWDTGDQDMDGHAFGSDFHWQRLDDTLTYPDGNVVINKGSLSITDDGSNAVTLTESGSGDFTIDAPDDIRLDAGGADIVLKTNGSEYARLTNDSQDLEIKVSTNDKDFKVNGYDDSTEITALRLDMSDNGWAHFNGGISVGAGNSTFAGNILPSSDSSFNLGSDSVRWASIYSDGIATSTITLNTIRLNDSITILNKTQTAYISFATRNTDGSQTVLDLTNVGNITLKDYIIHDGDANTYYGFEGNDQFRIVVGGAEKLHINSSRIRINDDLHAAADSSYDIGTSSVRFRNIYADTLYGDGSNITGITSTDNTKVAKAGDTMTGTLTVDGGGSSSVLLKTKGSARIALENANATNSFYLSNTGGNGASVLDIGGSLSVVEGGSTTFTGDIIGSGNLFLRSYNSSGKGIFFRDGFEHGDNNPYNLSITILNDGDGSADALEINAYDGIYFNTGSGTQNIRAKIGSDGNATFYGNVTLNSRLTFDYGGDHYFEAGTNSLSYKSSGGTSVMTLNALTQTAVFSGVVSVPTGKTFRLYNAAGTGWGEIGLEESENKIQFNRGIKPSGNNQTDQTLGTSTKRWHTLYAGAGNFSGTLDINGTGNSTFAGPISITPPSSTGWQGLTITGSGTSHTQGAIVLKSSTTDTPEARGQGVFMFNEGDDVTWYMGTRYQDADEWQLGRKTGTSINTEAAESGNAFLKMHNSGRATFTGSVFVQSDDNDKFLVRSNDYTISRIISRGSSGADLDKGLFSLMSSDGTNNNVEKVRIDSAGNSWFNGGAVSFGDNVTIEGDLNITGDINSTSVTNLDVDDKTITIAKGAADSAAADEAGIVVDGADASILYDHTGTKWKLNKPVHMSAAKLDFDLLNNHARIKASSSTLFLDAVLIQTQGNLIPDGDSNRDLGQSNRYFEDGYIETLHHKGLSPTAGSNIDQVFEFWSTNGVLTADTWTNVSGKIDISDSSETAQVFDGNIMATGTYALQMYVDDHDANGNHYGEYYSGTLTWYAGGTNSTIVDEIVLHRAGHAPNAGHIQLRTKRTVSSDGKLYLQMKHSRTLNNGGITGASNKIVKFKFRRLI